MNKSNKLQTVIAQNLHNTVNKTGNGFPNETSTLVEFENKQIPPNEIVAKNRIKEPPIEVFLDLI